MKLPISFKDFASKPIIAISYLAISAVVYLYVDLRIANSSKEKMYKEQQRKCETKNYIQDVKIEILTQKLQRSDSLMNRLASKLETLKELGKIE